MEGSHAVSTSSQSLVTWLSQEGYAELMSHLVLTCKHHLDIRKAQTTSWLQAIRDFVIKLNMPKVQPTLYTKHANLDGNIS